MEIFGEQRGNAVAADPRAAGLCAGESPALPCTQPAGSLQPLCTPALGMLCSLESNACISPRQDLFTIPFLLARTPRLQSPLVQRAGEVVAPPAMALDAGALGGV